MACLYKRRNKFWISYVCNGRLVQKSLRTDNERVAKDKVKQIEYELAVGNLQAVTKLPLRTILESYCRYQKATKTYKTYKNDVSRLRIVFGPICQLLEILPPGSPNSPRRARPSPDKYAGQHIHAELLEDVTAEMLNRWLSARVESNAWSAKTFNNFRQTLHTMFAYAIKHHGFVCRDRRFPNPAAGVDRMRESAPNISFLKLPQIEEQLKVLQDHPVLHAMVATAIYSGLRRGEVVMLTREDVDLTERLIRVRAKTVDGESWQPKTKRNRVVPISDALFTILSRFRPPIRSEWLFTAPQGRRWDVDNFAQDLAKINKKHGLPWSCGDFRHTFGSHLAQKGESLYKISALMGNSPEICRKHYAALIPEEMRDTVEFGQPRTNGQDPPPAATQALLEQLLAELAKRQGAEQPKEGEKPRLRIAK